MLSFLGFSLVYTGTKEASVFFFQAQLYRGEAGDRIIYYTAVDRLAGNKPTITIYDPKRSSTGNSGNASDKIIYE